MHTGLVTGMDDTSEREAPQPANESGDSTPVPSN